MRAAVGAALLVLSGCGGTAPGSAPSAGTPLEHGLWRVSKTFSTPKIDGLSVDSLRARLPADSEKTECVTPFIRTGPEAMEMFNLRQDACDLTSASTANGTVAGEGQCPGLAKTIASGGGIEIDHADSWIKIGGAYEPRYVKIDADIVMTATTERGATSRLTVNATHTAERIGDCP